MRRNASVQAGEVQQHAAEVMQGALKLKDYGRTCAKVVLVNLLLYAVVRKLSLSRAAERLVGAPGAETARQAALAQLPSHRVLERRINDGLVLDIPKRALRRAYPVAIDLHLQPYYGQRRQPREVVSGPKDRGTTHFYSYATACIVRRGMRFTVGAIWVLPGEPLAEVVKRLLKHLRSRGVKIRYLLADAQFFTAEVIQCLQAGRTPFVMPVAHRGRKPKDPARSKGTRQFLVWRRSGWGRYQWTTQPHAGKPRQTSVRICVCGRYYRDRSRRRRRQVLVFACWRVPRWPPRYVKQIYRLRFGIETSYRQVEECHIRTSTTEARLRFFFLAVALIVRNTWVWFHLLVIAAAFRRLRLIARQAKLRYEKMLHMLERYIESLLAGPDLLCVKLQP
jgi:hypothetical protein